MDADGKPLVKYSPTNLAVAPNSDIHGGGGYGSISTDTACFDHAGNIFVVKWVEVGRVTKLRKVA